MVMQAPPQTGRLNRSQYIFWNALLLLLLTGCTSTPAQHSPTHAGTTPTPTFSPTPASPVWSYLPNDHDPFQATFVERATYATCPHSPRPTVMCWNVSGVGNSIPYGAISFSSFDINYVGPLQDPDGCEPTTRQGSVDIGNAMVQFVSSGTWCMNLVHFVYQVIGGTDTFRHAHGKGSIFIPDPNHNIHEYWTGTLLP